MATFFTVRVERPNLKTDYPAVQDMIYLAYETDGEDYFYVGQSTPYEKLWGSLGTDGEFKRYAMGRGTVVEPRGFNPKYADKGKYARLHRVAVWWPLRKLVAHALSGEYLPNHPKDES